ncbi:UNVERIFIED_CONTAM: 2-carboxy-1,4-naphthoquinone phytyltransferase, chloroplastic [Sesamum angustifolium]|uniref:2-carboxy-1,4-naphthoquinone phytyltransferase, chloroplastic n=1 Tax=Sesamum angustifolium TaxID=2727405 RepID=A0AAW2QBK8_9LAMI
MAAAATFCNVNNAYGIKKLRQDNNLVKNHHLQRNYSTLYGVQGPLLRSYNMIQTRYDQAFTSILRAKQEHARNRSLLECRAERGTALTEQQVEKDEDVSRATLIWRAIKLPMYTVGLIPASLGSRGGWEPPLSATVSLYSVLLLHLPVSTVSFELPRTWRTLMLCSIRPFATIGFYLLQSGTSELPISSTVISASTLVGFTSSLILLCSHFHQIKDDEAVGKISPLVRLGTEAGANVVKMAVLGLYWLVFAFGLSDTLPYASLIFCTTTLPMGNLVVNFVQENHKVSLNNLNLLRKINITSRITLYMTNQKYFMAKYFSVRLHTIFGAALTAGLVASRLLPGEQLPELIDNLKLHLGV